MSPGQRAFCRLGETQRIRKIDLLSHTATFLIFWNFRPRKRVSSPGGQSRSTLFHREEHICTAIFAAMRSFQTRLPAANAGMSS